MVPLSRWLTRLAAISNCSPGEIHFVPGLGNSLSLSPWKGGQMQRNLAVPKRQHVRKKVRGSKRKLRSFGRELDSILLSIPDKTLPHDKSWRYHLPSPNKLVDSTDSSWKLRRRFVQLLADKLVELDDGVKGKYRALLFLSLPLLSNSRIEICVDKKRVEELIGNPDAASTWTPIIERSIIREFRIALPTEYVGKGYCRMSTGSKIEESWIIWRSM
jgi:hypothetical protein